MDESVFTTQQVNLKVWFAPQREPITVTKRKLSFKAIAVAAAINMDGVVVALHTVDMSINTGSYCDFLDKVAQYTRGRKCVMMVDNLSVHRTDPTKAKAAQHNIELVFNGSYSSWYNPIERLWAWAKARFTKRCVDGAPYHLQHRMRELVESVIREDYTQGLKKRINTCLAGMIDYMTTELG